MVILIQKIVSCVPSTCCFLFVEICCVCMVSKGQNQAIKVFEQGGAVGLSWDGYSS